MTETQSNQSASSRLVRPSTIAGALVGLGIVAILVKASDPQQTWLEIQSVDLGPLLAALALNVPVVLIRTYRAQTVLGALSHPVPYRRMFLVQLVGQTVSSGTPAASGDLVRAYFWRRDDAVPAARGVAAVAFERVYSFVLLGSVGFAFLLTAVFGAVGTGLGLVAIALVVAIPWLGARLPEGTARGVLHRASGFPIIGRLAAPLDQAFAAVRDLVRSGSFLARFATVTLVLFAINGAQLWLLVSGLGSDLSVPAAIGIFALAQTGGTVSTLPFGLGTTEVLMTGLLLSSGVATSDATPAALLLRAVVTLPLALAAIAAYFALEHGIRARRAEGQEADTTSRPEVA